MGSRRKSANFPKDSASALDNTNNHFPLCNRPPIVIDDTVVELDIQDDGVWSPVATY